MPLAETCGLQITTTYLENTTLVEGTERQRHKEEKPHCPISRQPIQRLSLPNPSFAFDRNDLIQGDAKGLLKTRSKIIVAIKMGGPVGQENGGHRP